MQSTMQHCMGKRLVPEKIIPLVTPIDAVELAASCRAGAEIVQAFDAAIAFALTRPSSMMTSRRRGVRQANGICSEASMIRESLLDVGSWQLIWEACSQSVAAHGLDPSAWAYSAYVKRRHEAANRWHAAEHGSWVGSELCRFLDALLGVHGPMKSQLVSIVQRSVDTTNATVMAVLMVDEDVDRGWVQENQCDSDVNFKGTALAVLSDAQFALFFWELRLDVHGDDGLQEAYVFIDTSIPALFELAQDTTRKHCQWLRVKDHSGHGRVHLTVPNLAQPLTSERDLEYYFPQVWAREEKHLEPLTVRFRGNAVNYRDFAMSECLNSGWKGKPRSSGSSSRHEGRRNYVRIDKLARILASSSQTHGMATWRTARPPYQDHNVTHELVMPIVHDEPPASRDPELLQEQADCDWAEHVENRIQAGAMDSVEDRPAQPSNKVHLVSFRSGKGELFRKMLLQDKEFRPLRKELGDAGYPCVLKCGTIVLVRPDQYLETRAALRAHTLKRYMVAIAETEEPLMQQVLARMASKQRPREHAAERKQLDVDGLINWFMNKRTFLCTAPQLCAASSVHQSTTEAVRSGASSSAGYYAHNRGRNPRRLFPDTWLDE
eukprot:gb/GFBE01019480.1/.p1 GENE.gb/GFBE01019480.1/~~gb/GFBE01019480.1/.p1  ORF type:complete len:606 (+),score=83.73 gb/GFBE01019480.1/:1-1818(+)